METRIVPVGESALLVEFANDITPQIQARVGALNEVLSLFPHPALRETVPTYRSLLLYYNPLQSDFEEMARWLGQWLPAASLATTKDARRRHTLPVLYGGEGGPDLETVARHNSLTPQEVIKLHQEPVYLVYMLGFLPGFPYLGGLNPRLATPRLPSPRTLVPAGSVGIAAAQTGVYPLASPGGWQLIGRTPMRIFDPHRAKPFLFSAGDELCFQAVDAESYAALAEEEERKAGSLNRAVSSAYSLEGLGTGAERSASDGQSVVKVIAPGFSTTVQDLGRAGWQRFGVPVAGVFDQRAALLANYLVGNAGDAALLEITYLGPTLETEVPLLLAFTGAPASLTLDGEPQEPWQSFLWQPGKQLQIGGLMQGVRSYLAVAGGWQTGPVMGSRSTYERAQLGGIAGRQLKAGDLLPVDPEATDVNAEKPRRLPAALRPLPSEAIILPFVAGPQSDYFPPEALENLTAATYQVSPVADRMGVRLNGPAIVPLQPDIISDAIAPGSIQVPEDGQPIIMGPDRQTTGGYPKIGTVTGRGLDLLAQARPGDQVKFKLLSPSEARQELLDYQATLKKWAQLADKDYEGWEWKLRIAGQDYYCLVEELEDE